MPLCLIFEFELELRVDEGEAHAMVLGRSELLDGLPVRFGGVSFVLCPLVGGVIRRDLVHVVVTVGLGKDGGCRDGHVLAIPFHHALVFDALVGSESVTVYDEMFRPDLQLVDCSVHGEEGGVQNVYLIDFLGGYNAYRPGDGLRFDDGA